MTDFFESCKSFGAKVEALTEGVFQGTATDVLDSIQNGSPITGSPGQPVGQYGPDYHPGKVGGQLRASWQLEFESKTTARVSTNTPYAESNEDGIARPRGGPYIQRSTVGGRFSVEKTMAGIQAIVDDNVARLGR